MKKVIISSLFAALVLIPAFALAQVLPEDTAPPFASIGATGNTGPAEGGVYHSQIPVFATVVDSNLENYHFRVVKDGTPDGNLCEEVLGSLFAPENQGYASTTLDREMCGFAYNQSVYTSTSGFVNSLIATLSAEDLISFAGEGDYWLIIGAKDLAGNRFEDNWLNDPKIKINIKAGAAPVSETMTSNSNSNSDFSHRSSRKSTATTTDVVAETTVSTSTASINSGTPAIVLAEASVTTDDTDPVSTSTATTTDMNSNLAAAILAGFGANWLWLLLALNLISGLWYYSFQHNK